MSKNKENKQPEAQTEPTAEAVEEVKEPTETERMEAELAEQKDQYLRLAAEYDNFRKRSQREKDAIYTDAVADTAKKFLPVYDNLLRALQGETADEAYKKGVEMIQAELVKTLEGLSIVPFGAVGEPFDPEKHNAVMHCEDEAFGENVIADVFQTGFLQGEKVIRFAMVKVAN